VGRCFVLVRVCGSCLGFQLGMHVWHVPPQSRVGERKPPSSILIYVLTFTFWFLAKGGSTGRVCLNALGVTHCKNCWDKAIYLRSSVNHACFGPRVVDCSGPWAPGTGVLLDPGSLGTPSYPQLRPGALLNCFDIACAHITANGTRTSHTLLPVQHMTSSDAP
jgi:hypothetical protein